MKEVNLYRIKQYLWQDQKIRTRIERDYFIEKNLSFEEFSDSVISSLNQPVKSIFRRVSNEEFFEAVVKALGSNSRRWNLFSAQEPELKKLLYNYDPGKVYINWSEELAAEIKFFFPGQTRSNDVNAIFQWSKKLTYLKDFYQSHIMYLVFYLLEKSKSNITLNDEHIFLLVCAFCSAPSNKLNFLEENYKAADYKFHGMSYTLSSELLRNLGWNGFKPDRHIKRLFNYWYRGKSQKIELEKIRFKEFLCSQQKPLDEFINYSLIGYNITPDGFTYSEVDNLLWMFGSYVVKIGKEADFPID